MMRLTGRARVTRLLAASGGVLLALSVCLLAPRMFGAAGCLDGLFAACLAAPGMPMHQGPVWGAAAVAALAAALIGAFAWQATRHAQVARALGRAARSVVLHDQQVGLVPGVGGAVVAGLSRPRVYCSEDLVGRLDDDEMRAVLLHERHHQTTLAPLRLVAIGAVEAFVGWSALGRQWIARMRADVEIAADGHALAAGVPRAVLARAVVKVIDAEPRMHVAGFATAADLRLRALLSQESHVTVGRPSIAIWTVVLAFAAACAGLAVI
jgi:beta-lactamase regulating signal transducer with metallopeptidase domain